MIKNIILPNISGYVNYIDFTNGYIRTDIEIGRFVIPRKWQPIKNLKYISVFQTDNGCEVNLWYESP